MIARWMMVVVCVCSGLVRGDIEVRAGEFPPDQQDEIRAIVAQVEQTCSRVFGVDVASVVDSAFIEVHLNKGDYEIADRDVANGAFRNSWSFASARAMQGHVALQPPLEFRALEESGLPLQTKIRVANVTVYLCIYRAFDQGSSFPDWIRRGLSGHLGNVALRELGVMGALETEPWTSTEIHTIRRLFASNAKFDLDSIMENESDDASDLQVANVRGAFVGWLMELGVLDQVIAQADRTGAGESAEKQLRAATIEAIRSVDIENPDLAFRHWIDSFDPEWDEERRSLTTHGDEWHHSAWDRRKAMCWNKQTLGDRDWEISGQLKIFKRDNTQMDILFGSTDAGFMTVALSPEFGAKVFHCTLENGDREKDTWKRLETRELRTLELGEWADFVVSKRRDRLIVKINKERPVMLDVAGIDLDGNWGLGCQYRSAGVWRDVVVKVK